MATFADALLTWFDQHGRKDLPWQRDVSPYRVWVSEIMLQQTQVATVIPYYNRFMERFPSIDQLANATQDEVLHLWTGLGYYARARNLHKTAELVMSDYNGEMPMTTQALETLPGIGRSTAGAIVSICTNTQASILDGNVKRVLARHYAIGGWPGNSQTLKALWHKAEELTPADRVADYTQAIMDLGAMVCTRSAPTCYVCPFTQSCQAKAEGRIGEFPGRKPKKVLPVKTTRMLIVAQGNEVLLEQRPAEGLWGGLWSFPEPEDIDVFLDTHNLQVIDRQSLSKFRHTFTHFQLDISPELVNVKPVHGIAEPDSLRWYLPQGKSGNEEIGLTGAVVKILKQLHP